MDVEGAGKEGVRVDRGDGGKYVGSQSKYAGGSGLHGVGGGGSSQRWRKQACKENDRHIKWTVRLDHIGVRCIRNNNGDGADRDVEQTDGRRRRAGRRKRQARSRAAMVAAAEVREDKESEAM